MKRAFILTASGIAGGQGLVLLATPFLARIYSPEQFGVYAGVVAMAGVIASISALRFDASIPAAKDNDVVPLFQAGLILPLVVCPASLLLFQAIAPLTGWGVDLIERVSLWAVVLVALLQGMVGVLLAYFTRAGWFDKMALMRLVQPSVFAGAAMVAFGSLEFAFAAGWLAALLFGVFVCRSVFSRDLGAMFGAVRRTWKFPVMSVPMTLLDSLTVAMPLLFILAAFGSKDAGSYSQVQRLIGAPLILAGLAVAQVFYKYAGDKYRSNASIAPLLWRVVGGLSLIGFVLVLVALSAGEYLLGFLLGEGWRVDTWFVILTLIPVVARLIVSPVSTVFLITNRLEVLSIWQLLYFIVTLTVLTVGKDKLGFDDFILAFGCSECVMYGSYLFLAVRVAQRNRSGEAS